MGTVTLTRPTRLAEITSPGEIILRVHPQSQDNESRVWQDINRMFSEPLASIPQQAQEIKKILLAPGIEVSKQEYEERFGNLNLEEYREQMSPELFKVFIRHIGSIPGKPKLDIVGLVTRDEE